MQRAVAFLRREQESEGSWFGRWGTNYIYGTWSVLCALNAIGLSHEDPAIRRARDWLVSVQREDGGWGEDEESYRDAPHGRYKESLPSQTAWALLGLMAAGDTDDPAVARGIAYLGATQRADGEWTERPYNAVGFPRVFYLRYHGYRLYFPLMALARYRNLRRGNTVSGLRDSRGDVLPLRIGLASGPVVAGVVGSRRFFYDVWGDAVDVWRPGWNRLIRWDEFRCPRTSTSG